jgi:3-hydroxymyristoyl/3-hydroxydecanoyl-(acyl carrier protein) dehydratase
MVTANPRVFDGHFDEAPVLPGVAQIALVVEACRARGFGPASLVGVRDVRFSRPLGPHDPIEIALRGGQIPSSVRFEIRTGGHAASSGTLLFATDTHDGA